METTELAPARDSSNLSAYVALGCGILILGLSAVLVRWAEAPGVVSAFYRTSIGSLAVGLLFGRRLGRRARSISRRGLMWAVLGGIAFALDLAFWATGITLSGATMPTLMANTAPLWVGLGAMVFFGERRGRLFWIGLVLALVGAVMVLSRDLVSFAGAGLGTAMGLMAAVFYGAYHLITQRGRLHLDTLSYFWITTTVAALVLLTTTAILGEPLLGYNAHTHLAFITSGIVVQGLGWLIVNYAQGYLSASVVAPTLLMQPVLTAVMSAVLLGELFSPWHVGGGIVVLGGIYLVHHSR